MNKRHTIIFPKITLIYVRRKFVPKKNVKLNFSVFFSHLISRENGATRKLFIT